VNRLGQRIKNLEVRVAQSSSGWSYMDDFNKVDQHAKAKLSKAERALFPQVWDLWMSRGSSEYSDEQRELWLRYEQAFSESKIELKLPTAMDPADLLL
jgi:hypothetical protein